jgi:hypothetical protein
MRLMENEDPPHRDERREKASRKTLGEKVGLPHFVQPPSSCESAITSPAPARIP